MIVLIKRHTYFHKLISKQQFECHDIAEKLLKLKLNTNQSINQCNQYNIILMCMTLIEWERVTCTQYCTIKIYQVQHTLGSIP
jgi:hypothetical protein